MKSEYSENYEGGDQVASIVRTIRRAKMFKNMNAKQKKMRRNMRKK